MKIVSALSVLLLGTTLLAGGASADSQSDNNPSPPPPHPGWQQPGPPPHVAPPQDGRGNSAGRSNFNGGPNFRATHSAQNQARWNHVVTVRDRNVAHFNVQDRALWTQGQWKHARHHGHDGWWWNTNGAWFFYDQPVYPYPGYVSEDYSFDDDADAMPDQGAYFWYYCNNPPGYYPYVQSCRGPWRPVTPTPPPGYDNQGPQGGPDAYDDDNRGPPPQDQYRGPPNGPQQGYDNDGGNNDEDQGPPPPGYNGEQGPPPGYGDQPPPR